MKIVKTLSIKLAAIEIWIIAGGVLISVVYPPALPGVVIIGIVYWIIRRYSGGRFTERTVLDLSILIFLLLIPLNLWTTAIPLKTYPEIFRLLSGIILFYAVVNWALTSKRIRWMVVGVVIATTFLAFYAMISVEWMQTKLPFIPVQLYNRFVLLVSDTVQHNVMAGFLVILYPIILSLLIFLFKELSPWKRLLLIITACIVFTILVLTQSRGGLIALGSVVLLLVILKWKRGWIIIPISIIAVGGAIAYLGLGKSLDLLSSGVSLEGLQGRLEVWSRAIFMIQDFPITGVGMGLFGDVTDSLYPLFLNAPGTVPHAHNLFLQIAVDMGIPGLITWLSILFVVIAISWQLYRFGKRRQDHWVMGLGAGLLCSQAALIVHGMLDAVTWGGVRPAPIVWAIWGLACAAWNYYRKRM
jgi:O-antigen ligase